MSGKYSYISDPQEIMRASFALIEQEADLSRVPGDLHAVACRIAHALGDVAVIDDLVWSGDVAGAAQGALSGGATILVDAEMVAKGIIRNRLPAENDVLCTLKLSGVAGAARRQGLTRSAAALDFWEPWIAGAVVAIGNAPTALYRLLERLADGLPAPAAILAFPVGFIGAAESKQALIDSGLDVPFLTLTGRHGGSAVAAAAVNALAKAAP